MKECVTHFACDCLQAEIGRLRDENQWICDSRNKLAGESQSLTVECDQLKEKLADAQETILVASDYLDFINPGENFGIQKLHAYIDKIKGNEPHEWTKVLREDAENS